MSFLRFIILIGCILISSSCDQKTSSQKKSIQKEASSEKRKQKDTILKPNNIVNKKKKEAPFKLTNENLRTFFADYGKKNPETIVRISTRFGKFDIQLNTQTPIHRANFIYLVKQKYFDETFFYRVAKGFVIQGGNSDRTQMSQKRFEIGDYTLPQEQVKGQSHIRGAVALSKQWVDNPSNRSTPYEFFVVVAKQGAHHLDGEHTIFGKVIKGMNVVDKISNVPTDESEWPIKNIFIKAEVIR
ncbi:peptidylprolyl isomerase [Aquimarina rhabdastrellae]